MKRYKAVVFDIDGTIVDTERAILDSLHETMLAREGRDLPEEELAVVLGVPGQKALADMGVMDIQGFWKQWDDRFIELAADSKVFDGVEETILALHEKGIKLGIVTSKNKSEWEDAEAQYPCLRLFSAVVTANDTERHKPEADPMLAVLERLSVQPSEAVYLGDTVYDMLCAENAGADGALAVWGCREPEKITAAHKLNDPCELLALVE